MVKVKSIKEHKEQGYGMEITLDMVQHRRYFKRNGCQEVEDALGKIKGVERIVVVGTLTVLHLQKNYVMVSS